MGQRGKRREFQLVRDRGRHRCHAGDAGATWGWAVGGLFGVVAAESNPKDEVAGQRGPRAESRRWGQAQCATERKPGGRGTQGPTERRRGRWQ